MLSFTVDQKRCVSCGKCAKDCLPGIITLDSDYPAIIAGREGLCLECQHCLAVCPTGAISVFGKNPDESLPLAVNLPTPDAMEAFIKGRRSVRQYKDENVKPQTLRRLLDVVSHAPTGCNARQVHFTVIDDRDVMAKLRTDTMEGLASLSRQGKMPPDKAFFAGFVKKWEEKGIDSIYRGAPHLVIASAPKDCPTPEADCFIALSYFELFAQTLGVGTVWVGLAQWTFNVLVPELRNKVGIPENHTIGYIMAFGMPDVHYSRTVQRRPAKITKVSWPKK